MEAVSEILALTAIPHVTWRMLVMWVVVAVLFYLGVGRKFEPLLLVPIAFGALLANLPTEGMVNPPIGRARGRACSITSRRGSRWRSSRR